MSRNRFCELFEIAPNDGPKNKKSKEIGLNANKILQQCALNQTNIKFKLHSRIVSITLIWARDSNLFVNTRRSSEPNVTKKCLVLGQHTTKHAQVKIPAILAVGKILVTTKVFHASKNTKLY